MSLTVLPALQSPLRPSLYNGDFAPSKVTRVLITRGGKQESEKAFWEEGLSEVEVDWRDVLRPSP